MPRGKNQTVCRLPQFENCGTQLNGVNLTIKSLGVFIDENLSRCDHIDAISKKIEIATWASCNPQNIIHGLFQSCVHCYSVGWGYSGKALPETLQKLQNCVVRALTPATKLVRLTTFLKMGQIRNSTSMTLRVLFIFKINSTK